MSVGGEILLACAGSPWNLSRFRRSGRSGLALGECLFVERSYVYPATSVSHVLNTLHLLLEMRGPHGNFIISLLYFRSTREC